MRKTCVGSDGSAPRVAGGPPPFVLQMELTAGHLLRRAQQVHTALWLVQFGGEVTAPQFAVLLAAERYGPVDQNSMGQLVSLDKSTAADVIARLEKHGWLDRAKDRSDGRRNLLTLTRPARAAFRHLTGGVIQVQQRLVEPIEPHRRRWFVDHLAILAYAGTVPTLAANQPNHEETSVGVPLRLERAPGHLIRRAEQLHQSHWLALVGSRLTPSQYGLMTGIASNPLLDQRDAGERASLDKSSTSDIAARLARRGLIGRDPDQKDRRRKRLYLTEKGLNLMKQLEPDVRAVQAALIEPLSEEDVALFTDLLRTVAYRE